MSELTVRFHGDGTVELAGLPAWVVQALGELPELASPVQEGPARDRLFPNPSDDEAQNEEWERMVVPELFALLVSAQEVVQQDLARLAPPREPFGGWTLRLPPDHTQAWISALNAARLNVASRHALSQPELEGEADVEDDVRDAARRIVDLYGLFQSILIRGVAPPPPDEDDDPDPLDPYLD